MSLPIHVVAHAGFKANERPLSFSMDLVIGRNGITGVYDIDAVEDRWYDPNAEYFKVRTTDGKTYLLRCDAQTSEWTLQSAFDGAELLARSSITLVTVPPEMIRAAEQRIAGCEGCREDEAELPFAHILADVLDKRGPYDFILSEPGHCPNCKAELSEKSLVEPQGGIEVEASPVTY